MRLGTGIARTLVLAAWASLFVALWVLDEGLRYLGPRTQWVIPFGAVTLTLAAVAHGVLAATRRRDSPPLTRGEAVGTLALLLPFVALLLVPQPSLGAHAASKRRTSNDVLVAQLPSSGSRASAARKDSLRASFVDVAVATMSPAEGAGLGLAAGARVRVHGRVVHESEIPGTFGLARFFISCCAADALPIVIPVDPGAAARPPQDQWLLVTGTLARRGASLVVLGRRMQKTEEPSSPYVSTGDGGSTATGTPTATGAPPPPAAIPPPGADKRSGARRAATAGFTGRAARVYDRYYEHCKVFTYEALAWPERARNAEEAARMFAGPPRRYQPPAFRGCLDGLEAGEASITLTELFARIGGAGGG
jgi:uncharacterized repeat protein (TIGR03943 family)